MLSFLPGGTLLRTRFSLIVVGLLSVVAVFLMAFFPWRMNRQSERWMEGKALGIAGVLATAASDELVLNDLSGATDELASLRTRSDARYARLLRGNGTELAGWGDRSHVHTNWPATDGPVLVWEEDTLHVRQAVPAPKGEKVVLEVGLSTEELRREKSEAWMVVTAIACAVFLFGVVASVMIAAVVIAPMQRLTEVARNIVKGDLAGAETVLGGRVQVELMSKQFETGGGSQDEMVQLSAAFARMLSSLRGLSSTLHQSAGILTASVVNLTASAGEQSQTITKQAAALQQTQVTAQEIKQTSVLAAQKADAVVQVAERADLVSRSGEAAIEQSLEGLNEIRSRVEAIANKIGELSDRARQIGSITQTVKDLADQSNMLALNAAIEAVRSGEHGKGFAVVAREIRSLADQSIQATNRVREILEDIGSAVSVAVTITEEGADRIEAGLGQVRSSGENIRELSAIVKDNALAVRQIASAVSQQNIGFTQIFTAVTDLSSMMDDTIRRIESTHQAVTSLKDVSERVSDVANHYRL